MSSGLESPLATLFLIVAMTASAQADVVTREASVDRRGLDPAGFSAIASVSADGRYVAFQSFAGNLVQGDGNSRIDVFVRDLVAGTTVRASVDATGGDANDYSLWPSISTDGRYVAFASAASDLVPGDGNGVIDVFVRDLVAGTTVRASVDALGGDPDGNSTTPAITPDGRYVAFASYANDLVPGDRNGYADVFVRDLVAGTTTRVSVDRARRDTNGASYQASITPDGRFVAFYSLASDLVAGDRNSFPDVFVGTWWPGPRSGRA